MIKKDSKDANNRNFTFFLIPDNAMLNNYY